MLLSFATREVESNHVCEWKGCALCAAGSGSLDARSKAQPCLHTPLCSGQQLLWHFVHGAEGDRRDEKSRRSTQTPMNFFVQRIAPCPQCYLCSDAFSGPSSGHHTKRCRGTKLDRGSSQIVALGLERAETGAHRLNACKHTLGNESGGCLRTLKTSAMTALR